MSDHRHVVVGRETFWDTLPGLVRDPIVDVRIRVARLLALISGQYHQPHRLHSLLSVSARRC